MADDGGCGDQVRRRKRSTPSIRAHEARQRSWKESSSIPRSPIVVSLKRVDSKRKLRGTIAERQYC